MSPQPMDASTRELIRKIHDCPTRAVLVLAGGGSRSLSDLLTVPGASRTILDSVSPYSRAALIDRIGPLEKGAASPKVAVDLARWALRRARILGSEPLVGVGCTAALTTDRERRGANRCHVATASSSGIRIHSCELARGERDRPAEEALCARLVLQALASAVGIPPEIELGLGPGDRLSSADPQPPSHPLQRLLHGSVDRVTRHPDGRWSTDETTPTLLLPGSFDPLHRGHRLLVQAAEKILEQPITYELSLLNVDKESLAGTTVESRVEAFDWLAPVEVTRAPRFTDKIRLFPGATFIVGADTASRILDPAYQGGTTAAIEDALEFIAARGGRFLVAARRLDDGPLLDLNSLPIPAPYASIFESIPTSVFRLDISSSEIRGHRVERNI